MVASQAASVVQASFRIVGTDVVVVSLRQFLDTFLNASEGVGDKKINVNIYSAIMLIKCCHLTYYRNILRCYNYKIWHKYLN